MLKINQSCQKPIMLGPLFLANESRIKKAVWQRIGARETREIHCLEFLMLNGIYVKSQCYLLPLKEEKNVKAHSPPASQTSKEVLHCE